MSAKCAEHEAFGRREDAQESDIGRKLSADAFATSHGNQANHHDCKCHPIDNTGLSDI